MSLSPIIMENAHAFRIVKPPTYSAPKLALLWMNSFCKLISSPLLIMIAAKTSFQRRFPSVGLTTHLAFKYLYWIMQPSVITDMKKLKICNSIVFLVPVFMVNLFTFPKFSTKVTFHNESVFQHPYAALNQCPYISIGRYCFSILERWMKLWVFPNPVPSALPASLDMTLGRIGSFANRLTTSGAFGLVSWIGRSTHRVGLSLIHM